MREYIRANIQESVDAKTRLLSDVALITKVEEVANRCVDAYQKGKKILACGNGGSASDAMHMVGELVGRYKMERDGISAIALNANATVMTALGNDYDYDSIFAKQVRALGVEGDILFVISTSGNSKNALKACEQAKKQGIVTVALTGSTGGKLKECCDLLLNVPSDNTPRIQEMHILLIHAICGAIEKTLYDGGYFENR